MRKIVLFILANLYLCLMLSAQRTPTSTQTRDLTALIDKYSQAREQRDTALLRTIMIPDVDQLVSNGEWRQGIAASIRGMLSSSAASPGTRTLTVDRIRLLSTDVALLDCKYVIQDGNNSTRNMWSTFIAVFNKKTWRIAAIRNMLPAAQ